MNVLRDALRPQRALWRNLVLAFACVAAVLVGLLAMHALNAESHDHEVLVAHHSADTASTAAKDHCPGQCGMDDSMFGACILALAFGALTVAGAAVLSRWSSIAPSGHRPQHPAATAVGPAPPSLILLSISRT